MIPTLLRFAPAIFGCLLAACFLGLAHEAKARSWSFNTRDFDPASREDQERNRDGVRTLRIVAGVIVATGLVINLLYLIR